MAKPIEALSIQLKFKDAGSQAVIEKLRGSLKRLELGASGARPRIASLRKEILAQGNASVKSVANLQAQSTALKALRDEAKIGSRAFKQLTQDIAKLDAQMGKAQGRGGQRGMGARRATQAAGAVISGGIFGGPEGALGALGGLAVGGVEGAFAGAAIGAVVGGGRQALGETAAYAAQINKLKIALEGVAPNQDDFNFAVETAARATRELNVPQEQSIRGITRLTAAVTGAGGPVQDAATTFRNVTAAIKATGGSSEDVQGAITAMVQVFSKGKVSAEELSGQLGERLPGAVTLFAKANKMTLPELQKNLKAGTVGLNELMNFIRQLGVEFGGTANKIASSNEEAGARLNVAFDNMRAGVGQALLETGSDIQTTFGEFVTDMTPAVVGAAKAIATAMQALGKVLKPAVAFLGTFAAVFVAGKLAAGISLAVKGIASLGGVISTLTLVMSANPLFLGALAAAGVVAGIVAITNALGDQADQLERIKKAGASPTATGNQKAEAIAVLKRQISEQERILESTEGQTGRGIAGKRDRARARLATLRGELTRTTAGKKDAKTFEYKPVVEPDDPDADKSLARRIEQAQRLEARTEAQLRLAQAQGVIGRVLAQQANQRASLQTRINKLVGDGTNATINEAAANAKSNLETKQKLELQNRINQLYEQAKRPLEAIAQRIKDKVNGDKMHKRLIAEGVNPELAKELVAIDKAYRAEVRKFDAKIANLEAQRATALAAGKEVDHINAAIEALKEKLRLLDEDREKTENTAKSTIKEPTFAEGLEEAIANQKKALDELTNPLNQVIGAVNAMGDAFKNSFRGIIDGSMTAREALANFFQSIADHFADMAAQIAAEALKLAALKFVRSIIGSMFPGNMGGQNYFDPITGKGVAGPNFGLAEGGYVPGGFKAFNQGGVVSQPTLGMVGEGGEPEYIIPQSKMRESMARYSRGVRGPGVIPDNGVATMSEGSGVGVATPIDVRFSVERINNVDYVTATEFQQGLQQAAAQGAQRGEQNTLKRLQMSGSTRRRLGM
jgi:tape measure domain-containing protein